MWEVKTLATMLSAHPTPSAFFAFNRVGHLFYGFDNLFNICMFRYSTTIGQLY